MCITENPKNPKSQFDDWSYIYRKNFANQAKSERELAIKSKQPGRPATHLGAQAMISKSSSKENETKLRTKRDVDRFLRQLMYNQRLHVINETFRDLAAPYGPASSYAHIAYCQNTKKRTRNVCDSFDNLFVFQFDASNVSFHTCIQEGEKTKNTEFYYCGECF